MGIDLILSLDAGNGFIKASSAYSPDRMFDAYTIYRHALRQLTQETVNELESRGVLNSSSSEDCEYYRVNKKWYAIGESAIREGESAYKLGEARYTKDYYGILCAISLFRTAPSSENVFVYGTHTPKDMIYRPDLVNACLGKWEVVSNGQTKNFKVIDARGGDEPVMAYRHAILDNQTIGAFSTTETAKALRKGDNLSIDLGSYTLAMVANINGKTDYESARSSVGGVLEARAQLETAIRRRYRDKLKGTNRLNPADVDEALRTGVYNGRSFGQLDVQKQADDVLNPIITAMFNLINNYGGFGSFDTFLLAGGGCALLETKIRKAFKDNGVESVYLADEPFRLQHATSYGAMKTIKLALSKEKTI